MARYVVFDSTASNLVENDTNGANDVFVYDRVAGLTQRVSVSSSGEQSDSSFTDLYNPRGPHGISADGRIVLFSSSATNLVPNDTNSRADVFTHDRLTGKTEIVSVSSTGILANASSFGPVLSADGQVVAFLSFATNLVAGSTAAQTNLYVFSRASGKTIRIDVPQMVIDNIIPTVRV